MLGLEVAESTVGKYMARIRRPPSQGWKTFLGNHAPGTASLYRLWSVRSPQAALQPGDLRHAPNKDGVCDRSSHLRTCGANVT
jgi:hypothetical protein